jgi:CRP/FNR family transcriptional regulator
MELSIYSLLIQHFIDKESVYRFPKGAVLFQEKDPVDHVYLLLKGSISIGRLHERGKEFVIKILHGEELLTEYQIFAPTPRYHFYSKSLTDVEVLMIKREDFEQFIMQDQMTLSALTAWLSTRYLKAQMKCQDLMMNGKKGGLYSMLIRLCHTYGIRTDAGIFIDFPITHQELADLTYGTREVIQRLLKELREKDVITYEQQRITVKNLSYLKREVDCQNCPLEICGLN